MVIFGTSRVRSTIRTGQFNCPQCANREPYRHRKVTKFFTFYFIPLIPIDSAGEYVECRTCKGTYVPRVLSSGPFNKDEFMAIYEIAIKHSMVLIMLTDTISDKNDKKQVLEIINRFGHNPISMRQFEDYIIMVQGENKDVTTYLKKIGPALNGHGKETIIKCALLLASTNSKIDKTKLDLVVQMGEALEMSLSHLKSVFSEVFGNNKKPKIK